MNTNSAFYIGSTHDVCQDYTIQDSNNIVLTDGCSGSLHSDIGARIIAHTALEQINTLQNRYHDFKEDECIVSARTSLKQFNLPLECLDATLLFTIKGEKDIRAHIYGDGFIIIKLKDGIKFIIISEYTDSYPYFINYNSYPENRYRFYSWTENHDKQKVSISAIDNENKFYIINKDISIGYNIFIDKEKKYPIGDVRKTLIRTDLDIRSHVEEVEYIALSSDGISSFYQTIETDTSRINKPIHYSEVLKELLNFKSFKGPFVQKRMNKFRQFCAKNNWHHADDISLAVLYVGE